MPIFSSWRIKNEEKSQRLYLSTEKMVTEPKLKKLLLILAQEESTHKEQTGEDLRRRNFKGILSPAPRRMQGETLNLTWFKGEE